VVKNVRKLPRGAQNGGRQRRSFAKNWWRDETVRVFVFRAEKIQKLKSGMCGQTLINVGAKGVRRYLTLG